MYIKNFLQYVENTFIKFKYKNKPELFFDEYLSQNLDEFDLKQNNYAIKLDNKQQNIIHNMISKKNSIFIKKTTRVGASTAVLYYMTWMLLTGNNKKIVYFPCCENGNYHKSITTAEYIIEILKSISFVNKNKIELSYDNSNKISTHCKVNYNGNSIYFLKIRHRDLIVGSFYKEFDHCIIDDILGCVIKISKDEDNSKKYEIVEDYSDSWFPPVAAETYENTLDLFEEFVTKIYNSSSVSMSLFIEDRTHVKLLEKEFYRDIFSDFNVTKLNRNDITPNDIIKSRKILTEETIVDETEMETKEELALT